MTEDKSYSLWHHELAKQEFKNTYGLISWEVRPDIETSSIYRVLNKEYFDGKSMPKMCN